MNARPASACEVTTCIRRVALTLGLALLVLLGKPRGMPLPLSALALRHQTSLPKSVTLWASHRSHDSEMAPKKENRKEIRAKEYQNRPLCGNMGNWEVPARQ